MTHEFQTIDATRENILIRLGLSGPAGSGKTWTTLLLGALLSELLGLGPVFLIDSENRSSLKYARSRTTGKGFQFKAVCLPPDDYSPAAYMAALAHCESQGAKLIIIDSLSHAWNGTNGVLEQVDQITKRSRSRNAFTEGWREMTPVHNQLIQRILQSPAHILLTMRAKVDWVVTDTENGKKAPSKVGMAPVQREGTDYEPDLMFDMSVPEIRATVSKTRCDRIGPGEMFDRPGFELALRLAEWVHDEDLPRSINAALDAAIEKGAQASSKGEAGRREYVAARSQLEAWCRASTLAGRAPYALADIVAQFKNGVRARLPATPAAASPAAPGGNVVALPVAA